jgi:hypothetical protein
MVSTAHSHRKSHFHEIFSCPFGHFVVQKEFLAYLGSLTPYHIMEVLLLDERCFGCINAKSVLYFVDDYLLMHE